ncbi:septation protein SepH [Dietzia aerolata]|uniref:Septation protein SepH n=1 Tax=Dietzia aerolata TaxID=595984 RepID=A0ABV5JKI1_9ACTN|nr:septation protein SepH [Dietzia aerolata]
MRKLRIIGVDTESSLVECEVPDSGEKFTVPLDDRFRAAARGEFVAAGGADRAPVTGTLRPREIQDRIRHGVSPEQVAADAGVPMSRIEGFAIPVLLERSNAAELARNSHPVLSDGPSLDTLADKVDAALDQRGIDPELVKWDAWRDRSGGWVVAISWPAGLSDDAQATWSFVPDSHGGSARPLNEDAERILDPSRATALRTVSEAPPQPPGPPPIRAVPASVETPPAVEAPPPFDPRPAVEAPTAFNAPSTRSSAADSPAPIEMRPPAASRGRTSADAGSAPSDDAKRSDQSADREASHARRDTAHHAAGTSRHAADTRPDAPAAESGKKDEREETSDDDFLQHTPNEPERKSSRRHPTMPSWEDVLLGVRSKDD